MIGVKTGEEIQRTKQVEKMTDIFGVSFDYLKGRDDGLEEIIKILREYKLTPKNKQEIVMFLEDFFLKNKKTR